jgi:hypothetical protein
MSSTLPARDGLLQVYAAIFIPVIFAVIFELNLDAWVNARINYEVRQISASLTPVRHGAVTAQPRLSILSGGERPPAWIR